MPFLTGMKSEPFLTGMKSETMTMSTEEAEMLCGLLKLHRKAAEKQEGYWLSETVESLSRYYSRNADLMSVEELLREIVGNFDNNDGSRKSVAGVVYSRDADLDEPGKSLFHLFDKNESAILRGIVEAMKSDSWVVDFIESITIRFMAFNGKITPMEVAGLLDEEIEQFENRVSRAATMLHDFPEQFASASASKT